MVLIVLCFGVDFFLCYFHFFFRDVWVTKWPTIGKIAANSAYYIVSDCLLFPTTDFGVGISF